MTFKVYSEDPNVCLTGNPHRFENRPYEINSRASAGCGRRETHSCNDCLAIKVVFKLDDGSISSHIVAPNSKQRGLIMYSKVIELPECIQTALKSIGYGRVDIEIEAKEKVSPSVAGGDGYKGFCMIINMETGETKRMEGSWGGSNYFSQDNQVDLDANMYTIPNNFAVIKGVTGYKVFADMYINPSNMAKYLPAKIEMDPRDRWILYTFKGLTSAGRKDEWNRSRDKPSEEDLNRLAALGFLKRSSNGATKITTEGRNALGLEYSYQTIKHPNSRYQNHARSNSNVG